MKYIVFIVLLLTLLISVHAKDCTVGWQCDVHFRTYYDEDCKIRVRELCPHKCAPDGCIDIEIETCEEHWICNGQYKALQKDDCSTASPQYCQHGCMNGTCLIKPLVKEIEQNITVNTSATLSEEELTNELEEEVHVEVILEKEKEPTPVKFVEIKEKQNFFDSIISFFSSLFS